MNALLVAGCLTLVLGLSGATYHAAFHRPPSPPRLGRRGRNRRRALDGALCFRLLEPSLRFGGAWVGPLLLPSVSGRLERALLEAGYPLGLRATELAAASVAIGAAVVGFLVGVAELNDGSRWSLLLFPPLAAAIPFTRLSYMRKRRGKQVARRLPSVLELIVMCMSAGLDLPSALRCVVESATDPRDPVIEELELVVRELELGRTRREALLGLSGRVPTAEVKELVNSVIQSEEKGVSLGRALAVQSRTLKLRRSMKAEQSASGAALMLMGPMSLIFLCVIALLLGPVLVRTTAGGLGS